MVDLTLPAGGSDAIASGDQASPIACCEARTTDDPFGYAKGFNRRGHRT
jgi:hypothetical protein